MKINSDLSELMVLMMGDSYRPEDATTAKEKARVTDVKELLYRNFAKKITLEGLAVHFFVYKYYLTRAFKE